MALNENIPADGDGVSTGTKVSQICAAIRALRVALNTGALDDLYESLWEVDGTETQLKTADEIDMQTKKIINAGDPDNDQELATKKYTDDKAEEAIGLALALS